MSEVTMAILIWLHIPSLLTSRSLTSFLSLHHEVVLPESSMVCVLPAHNGSLLGDGVHPAAGDGVLAHHHIPADEHHGHRYCVQVLFECMLYFLLLRSVVAVSAF